jgi:chromosome transmission fidelity protein 1
MTPMSEFTDQLFKLSGASVDRIKTFSCGHVVNEERICPLILPKGCLNTTFDFNYNNRTKDELVSNKIKTSNHHLNSCNNT